MSFPGGSGALVGKVNHAAVSDRYIKSGQTAVADAGSSGELADVASRRRTRPRMTFTDPVDLGTIRHLWPGERAELSRNRQRRPTPFTATAAVRMTSQIARSA